eukprot:scaffold824_cov64-Phaeocystis_antarctica.AAC.3
MSGMGMPLSTQMRASSSKTWAGNSGEGVTIVSRISVASLVRDMRASSMARTLRASALPCHTPKRGRTRTVSLPPRVYFRRSCAKVIGAPHRPDWTSASDLVLRTRMASISSGLAAAARRLSSRQTSPTQASLVASMELFNSLNVSSSSSGSMARYTPLSGMSPTEAKPLTKLSGSILSGQSKASTMAQRSATLTSPDTALTLGGEG